MRPKRQWFVVWGVDTPDHKKDDLISSHIQHKSAVLTADKKPLSVVKHITSLVWGDNFIQQLRQLKKELRP